jgi:hypothetical protein
MSFKAIVSRLRIILFTFSLILTGLPSVYAADLRIIDVAEVTWSGATKPGVATQDIANSIDKEVAPNWMRFTSLQGDEGKSSIAFKYGQTLLTPIQLRNPFDCNSPNFVTYMNSIRSEVYKQLKVDTEQDRYLIILTPEAGCIWSGRASIGNAKVKNGVMVLHNTSSAFVISHELGHTLGLGHTNLLRCESGSPDGPWSQTCKAVEYGGSIDVMGNVETTSPLSTYHQWRMGILNPSEVRQSWLNESIELTASDVLGGTRAIFIRDGKATYWIEYRRSSESSSYNPGLVIYRTDPPSPSVIDSPNPEDRLGYEPGAAISTDIWMLNLDSYKYSSTGRASGSMTLSANKQVSLYSGNVTIEALSSNSEKKITVKVTRKPDVNPPPIPPLTDSTTWRYPDEEIIKSGYEDKESTIKSFEALIDGKILQIDSELDIKSSPTYLDPFLSRRTIYQKNLPEGKYLLSIRAVDIWGNKSAWSEPNTVLIDRGAPSVQSDSAVIGIDEEAVDISLTAIKDEGSDLCTSQLVNDVGFVLQASAKKTAPNFRFKKNQSLSSSIQIFDCLGNGVVGDFSLENNFVPATQTSRTGKWVNSRAIKGALTCVGKCTASVSVSGRVSILMGEGDPTISLTGKSVAKIAQTTSKQLRTGTTFDVGSRKRVLRLTGNNFTLAGMVTMKTSISNLRSISRINAIADSTLTDSLQQRMARYGFRGEDFASGWTVLPMARGTTLEDPTLDLCATVYKSEIGRQYRRQVVVTNPTMQYIFLSSEVVKYKDLAAAQNALLELSTNFNECVRNKGGIESGGTFVDYVFSPLPESNAPLVKENSRVLVRSQIGKGVSARQLLAFYQFNGEMFTGLYILKAGEISFSDNEVKSWFDVAGVLAQRLETKF